MFLKINEVLHQMSMGNVPGLSIGISSPHLGLSLGAEGCGFFIKNDVPSAKEQSQFDSSRYILTPQGLYFYDEWENQLEIITTHASELDKLRKHFNKNIFVLSDEQLKLIQSVVQSHKVSLNPIADDSVFGAASLSKPLFAYLVLKLVAKNKLNDLQSEQGKFKLNEFNLDKFDLDTPLCTILPGLAEGGPYAEKITARMVLSHTTGIATKDNKAPEFTSKPGTEYQYNGVPYLYLQMALEKLTGLTLEELAQEVVFGKNALDMKNSTFLRPGYSIKSKEIEVTNENKKEEQSLFPLNLDKFSAISANSLRTTAKDYARFMDAWIKDTTIDNAFTSQISLTTDHWAKEMALPTVVLQKLAWGLGVGLELDKEGNVVGIFHSGDMNQWRAIMAMNPNDKTGIVYFAHSPNGDVLADEIISKNINIPLALQYICEKYGFATKFEDQWEEKQQARFEEVGYYFESLEGQHASKAEWFAEEEDFNAHIDERMKPTVEENIIRAESEEITQKFKESLGEIKNLQGELNKLEMSFT